jgi:4'-phosphopantetheinyl transferase
LQERLPAAPELLSGDEIERWKRFRFERDQHRFATTRQALRILLGSYSERDPGRVEFIYSELGKPSLANPACDLTFNVAHSAEHAMLAVGRNYELGVDLELQRPEVEIEELAARFFSPAEHEELLKISAAQRPQAFFQRWTAKEALLKALGTGLSTSLSSIEFRQPPGQGAWTIAAHAKEFDVSEWQVQGLPAPARYAAALAISRQVKSVISLQW